MESDPLLSTSPKHISPESFRSQTLYFLAVLGVLLLILSYSITVIYSFHWIVWLLLGLLEVLLIVYWLCSIHGFTIWTRGELPLTKDDDAKYLTLEEDGRVVEYYTWGSARDDATALVCLHGSSMTAKYFNQCLFPAAVLKQLNVKAISPSYPGHGGSDVQPYRRITDWPRTDLDPILRKEDVLQFLVIGSSYGTAHAMATAACFPKRCLGMGLNVPYLPESICREFGFWTDADMILREAQLERPWILLPILSLLSLFQGFLPGAINMLKESPKGQELCPEALQSIADDCQRSFLRGVNGQVYEMTNAETTQTWQDPRTIVVPNVCVWYSQDDSAVPPPHGAWLADVFETKQQKGEIANVHVRKEQLGLGHFTYMTEADRSTGIMTKQLLQMAGIQS